MVAIVVFFQGKYRLHILKKVKNMQPLVGGPFHYLVLRTKTLFEEAMISPSNFIKNQYIGSHSSVLSREP